MSLIYQALKKLESIRNGYSYSTGEHTADGINVEKRHSRFLVIGILSLIGLSVPFILYLYSGLFHRGTDHIKVSARHILDTQLTLQDPATSAMALNRKGVELFKMERFADALLEFKTAVELEPENPVFRNNLGLTYMKLGEIDRAEEAFRKAVSLKENYPEALNNLGAILNKKGEHHKAIGLFKRSLELKPDYPDPYLNMAIALEQLGRYTMAIERYQDFLGLKDRDTSMDERIKKKIKRLKSLVIVMNREG